MFIVLLLTVPLDHGCGMETVSVVPSPPRRLALLHVRRQLPGGELERGSGHPRGGDGLLQLVDQAGDLPEPRHASGV